MACPCSTGAAGWTYMAAKYLRELAEPLAEMQRDMDVLAEAPWRRQRFRFAAKDARPRAYACV